LPSILVFAVRTLFIEVLYRLFLEKYQGASSSDDLAVAVGSMGAQMGDLP